MHTQILAGLPVLTDWHYLIYEIPLLIGGFFMVLSVIRPQHHGGGHAGHMPGGAHGIAHAPAAHVLHSGAVDIHPAHAHGLAHAHSVSGDTPARNAMWWLSAILGARDAPITLVINAGLLGWGVFGFCAMTALAHASGPLANVVIPMVFAAVGGFGSMHVSGRIFARFLPKDESDAISHDGLLGLTGSVVYPVTDSGGRVHIYDTYGTLHDESCRTAPGVPEIGRGAKVRVADIDTSGNLIVEEIG